MPGAVFRLFERLPEIRPIFRIDILIYIWYIDMLFHVDVTCAKWLLGVSRLGVSFSLSVHGKPVDSRHRYLAVFSILLYVESWLILKKSWRNDSQTRSKLGRLNKYVIVMLDAIGRQRSCPFVLILFFVGSFLTVYCWFSSGSNSATSGRLEAIVGQNASTRTREYFRAGQEDYVRSLFDPCAPRSVFQPTTANLCLQFFVGTWKQNEPQSPCLWQTNVEFSKRLASFKNLNLNWRSKASSNEKCKILRSVLVIPAVLRFGQCRKERDVTWAGFSLLHPRLVRLPVFEVALSDKIIVSQPFLDYMIPVCTDKPGWIEVKATGTSHQYSWVGDWPR